MTRRRARAFARRSAGGACAVLFGVTFLFASCAGVRAPGESRIILRNLAAEYYAVAEGYADLKNYGKAAEYYRLAMRDKSLRTEAYYQLARCYALAGEWDKALECYNDLLKKDADNNTLRLSVAYVTAMGGDVDGALALYKSLIAENPYDEQMLENYVALLISEKRGEDAEPAYFALKKTFPNNKRLVFFAGQLAQLVDNFSDAVPEE